MKIEIVYKEGEYYSGYTPKGYEQGQEMERLGLAKYLSGWGVQVDESIVKRLGMEFDTESQAVADVLAILNEQRERREAKERTVEYGTCQRCKTRIPKRQLMWASRGLVCPDCYDAWSN